MRLRQILRETQDVYSDLAHSADQLGGGDAAAATQLRKQLELRKREQEQQEQQRLKRMQPQFDQLKDAKRELDQISTGLAQGQQQQRGLTKAMTGVLPRMDRATRQLQRDQAAV